MGKYKQKVAKICKQKADSVGIVVWVWGKKKENKTQVEGGEGAWSVDYLASTNAVQRAKILSPVQAPNKKATTFAFRLL